MEERQHLLDVNENSAQEESGSSIEQDWSDESSNSSSYFSDTDSSLPDWETSVDSLGHLLYIECHPFLTTNTVAFPETEIAKVSESLLARNTKSRKSTRSKFLRLIRRRDSKRRSKRGSKTITGNSDQEQQSTSKVTFSDSQEGEIKEVTLALNSAKLSGKKLGRRITLVETLLGITISSFTDGNRIMVSGFTTDSEASKEKNIKIGDWLKKIDGIEVNTFNLKQVLEMLVEDTVTIQLQRVAGVEVTNQPPANELSTQTAYVKRFINYNCEADSDLLEYLSNEDIGVVFINTSLLTESGPEHEGIIYSYPYPLHSNSLVTPRGMFITLNNLIGDITNNKPTITTIFTKGKLTNVCYKTYESYLLLLMIPQALKTNSEILLQMNELACTLEFCYGSVNKCFEEQAEIELHHFFSRFFNNLLNDLDNDSIKTVEFENVLPLARFISLPKDAEMQIDEALSELEACDYREWNEEPLDCQRLFTILGSALYHNGYLLATHLTPSDTTAVHTYCRSLGLFKISRNEPVRAMVLWREIYPPSCGIGQEEAGILTLEAKQYLLIVGSAKDMLAVIMEAGGCTEPPEDSLGPDAFYVEEAQATLAHLQELGISELAAKWLRTNPGVQLQLPQLPPPSTRRTDFLSTHIPFTGKLPTTPALSTSQTNLATNKKPTPEVTSILKRRGSDMAQRSQLQTSADSSNSAELLQSDDSVSQGGYSELSDDLIVTAATSGAQQQPQQVVGRRAVRDQRMGKESDGEDSDIDDYRDGSQLSNSSYDFAEIRQALLNESEGLQPMKLTVGNENVLFHYVHLDGSSGILISPPDSTSNSFVLKDILANFNECCHQIHGLFQNTLRFKNLPPQEMAKSVMNKSVIAIKEYGTLFEYNYTHENYKKPSKLMYWVVGRIYSVSYPREIYVCYQDTIPQNLIEIAFKLGISNS